MRILILLLAFSVISLSVRADGVWPPDWKMIAGDGSVLPSDCIGSTETLDCFIDTLAACSAWSEGPRWREDATFYDHPVCTKLPGFEGLSVLWPLGPAATQLFLFRTDVWLLDRPEDWLVDKEYWDLARAGDAVIDFVATTCSPDPPLLEFIRSWCDQGADPSCVSTQSLLFRCAECCFIAGPRAAAERHLVSSARHDIAGS